MSKSAELHSYFDFAASDGSGDWLVGLLSLNARVAVAPVTLIEAMALHLDCADVQCPSARQAWTTIAQALNKAAKNVTDLQVRAMHQGMNAWNCPDHL